MDSKQLSHCRFALHVQRYGVEAWTAKPATMALFLLMLAEGIVDGFWVADGSQTPA